MLIDTHVHFDDFCENGSLDEMLTRADEASLDTMLAVAGTLESSKLSLELSARYPGRIFPSAGLDRDMAGCERGILEEVSALARDERVVAIGETGLDYHYDPESRREQCALFSKMGELAIATGKPLIVHSRDADDDTLSLLRDFAAEWPSEAAGKIGVLHCFTRDKALAKKILDLGFYISFSGIITFRSAAELRDVAAYVPADRILIETDSPYLAPVPERGKRNEPAFLKYVARELARVRNCDLLEIERISSLNAKTLFGF